MFILGKNVNILHHVETAQFRFTKNVCLKMKINGCIKIACVFSKIRLNLTSIYQYVSRLE